MMFRSHTLPTPLPSFQSIQTLTSPAGSISKRTPNGLRSRLRRGEMVYIGPTRLDFDRPSPAKALAVVAHDADTAVTPCKVRKRRAASLPVVNDTIQSESLWPADFTPDRIERDFRITSLVYPAHSHKFKPIRFSHETEVVCHVCLTKNIRCGRSCTFTGCPRVLCDDCVQAKFDPSRFPLTTETNTSITASYDGVPQIVTVSPTGSSLRWYPQQRTPTRLPSSSNVHCSREYITRLCPHPPPSPTQHMQPLKNSNAAVAFSGRNASKVPPRNSFPRNLPTAQIPTSPSKLLQGLTPVEVLALRLRLQVRQGESGDSAGHNAIPFSPMKADVDDQIDMSPIGTTDASPKDIITRRLHLLTADSSPSGDQSVCTPMKRKKY